jgi:hypothetical protein
MVDKYISAAEACKMALDQLRQANDEPARDWADEIQRLRALGLDAWDSIDDPEAYIQDMR